MGRVVRMSRKESGVNLAPIRFFLVFSFLYGILEFWFLLKATLVASTGSPPLRSSLLPTSVHHSCSLERVELASACGRMERRQGVLAACVLLPRVEVL